jgi:serine/threonine protein kinase
MMERWRKVDSVFQEALQRDPAERDAYVREVCHGDTDLQREVVSLLANHQETTGFEPWAAQAAAQLIDGRVLLQPGQFLGPYRIDSFIAAGGMGEVYRATDIRLNRPVAIKVSAERFSERFEREALVIASLNHPNICTLYDVGPNYLVMEYVEGPTLAERIQLGPIPLADAMEIARQMAVALEEAHQRLVVHRDFKPGNVKIKSDGTAKVLDFGLAKLPAMQTGAGANATDSPTLTMAATQAGVLLGTAAYMSPEQARGEPVDKRADVWAFGVVLWEMLTGRRLFDGKTTSDVLAAVIRDEPTLSQVPAKVRPLLKRCLEKDPQRRLRDIGDAMGIIESAPESTEVQRVWLPWGVAALLLVAFAIVSFVHFRETPPEAPVTITSINPPENTGLVGGFPPALSPDGLRIVFGARGADGELQLWMRPLDSPATQPLSGTVGASYPFWSPDSRSIGFFSDGKLKRIEVSGGPAVTLSETTTIPHGGTWSPKGVIVFAPTAVGGPLQRVPAGGGVPTAATTLQPGSDYSHHSPWFLPDGRHFLFADQTRAGTSEVMLRIGLLDSREVKTIGMANSNAVYSSGYLLYLRENTLMAQPFDEKRLVTAGDAVPVADQVRSAYLGNVTVAGFSVAREGPLAYQAGPAGRMQLTWFDRGGKAVGTLGDPGAGDVRFIEFSPDRKSVAVTRRGPNDIIWIYDVARGLPTRFTVSKAGETDPVWAPDGRSIAYCSNAKGRFDLYRGAADRTGNEELLYADGANKIPTSWSPNGKFLLFFRVDLNTLQDIWVMPIGAPSAAATPSKPFAWLATPFREYMARFSPDGHWVVYQSNESGRFEIYVAPFPGPGGKRRLISTGGGQFPRWRADGKEIFYAGIDGMLMAAEVSVKHAGIEVGVVRSLGISVASGVYPYDVSADGKRFLVAVPREQKSAAPLTLVQNWTSLLKKK